MALTREVINIETAPKPIGPYSHAVLLGSVVYTSGQVGSDPKTRALVPGGIGEETRQAMKNLRHILESSGASLATVAKCTVFLADMSEFDEMNKVYAEFFPSQPPARSAFQVAKLPMNARVEIEVVAAVMDAPKL